MCVCASGRELYTRTPAKKPPSHCRVLHSFLYPKHLNINTLSVPESLCVCVCVCIGVHWCASYSSLFLRLRTICFVFNPAKKKKLRSAIIFSFSSIQPASSRCVEVLMWFLVLISTSSSFGLPASFLLPLPSLLLPFSIFLYALLLRCLPVRFRLYLISTTFPPRNFCRARRISLQPPPVTPLPPSLSPISTLSSFLSLFFSLCLTF